MTTDTQTPDEPQGLEVDFAAGFDDETDEYQLVITTTGLSVQVNVKPEGFPFLESVLVSLPQAVEEVIEQIAEARENGVQPIETSINDEETP